MVTLGDVDVPAGDRPLDGGRPRWRTLRRGLSLGALVVALAIGVAYHRQAWSYLTHWRGGPSVEWAARDLPAAPELRVAAVGDVGDGSSHFDETSSQMYEVSRDHPYDVIYLLGDNIYPRGDPADIERRVLVPLRPMLDDGTRLLAVLGNHDVLDGHGDDQLAALGMPGRWHAFTFGDVLLVGLDTEDDDPAQPAWLEQTLRESSASWKIVVMHRPPYSAGYQGSNVALRELYTPIFARNGVHLVLSGHDHDYQRSVPVDGVTYVVSGGGSSTRRTSTADFTAVAFAVRHHVDLAVHADHLLLRAIDSEGLAFDEVEIALDGAVTDLAPAASD